AALRSRNCFQEIVINLYWAAQKGFRQGHKERGPLQSSPVAAEEQRLPEVGEEFERLRTTLEGCFNRSIKGRRWNRQIFAIIRSMSGSGCTGNRPPWGSAILPRTRSATSSLSSCPR